MNSTTGTTIKRKKKKKLKGLTPSGIVPRAYHRSHDTKDLSDLLNPDAEN